MALYSPIFAVVASSPMAFFRLIRYEDSLRLRGRRGLRTGNPYKYRRA